DPGHWLPDIPRRPAALGGHIGPAARAGDAEEVRAPGDALPADGADAAAGGIEARLLRLTATAERAPTSRDRQNRLHCAPTHTRTDRRRRCAGLVCHFLLAMWHASRRALTRHSP